MGKRICLSIVILCLVVCACPAHSTLIDYGFGLTLDDKGTTAWQDDQYWIQDLHSFFGMTYSEQILAIESIHILGLDWHMATYSDILSLWNSYDVYELEGAFEPTSVIPTQTHWVGRYDRTLPLSTSPFWTAHYEVNMNYFPDFPINQQYSRGLDTGCDDAGLGVGAFVTANATHPTPPVPEPATLLLLGTGLVGLAGFRKKLK